MVELFESGREMARGACEAVKLPDQHTIEFAVAGAGHQGVEPPAAFLASRDGDVAIVSDYIETGALGISSQSVTFRSGFWSGLETRR